GLELLDLRLQLRNLGFGLPQRLAPGGCLAAELLDLLPGPVGELVAGLVGRLVLLLVVVLVNLGLFVRGLLGRGGLVLLRGTVSLGAGRLGLRSLGGCGLLRGFRRLAVCRIGCGVRAVLQRLCLAQGRRNLGAALFAVAGHACLLDMTRWRPPGALMTIGIRGNTSAMQRERPFRSGRW